LIRNPDGNVGVFCLVYFVTLSAVEGSKGRMATHNANPTLKGNRETLSIQRFSIHFFIPLHSIKNHSNWRVWLYFQILFKHDVLITSLRVFQIVRERFEMTRGFSRIERS